MSFTDPDDLQEKFFPKSERKLKRKMLTKKDRSKFKKTDQVKVEKEQKETFAQVTKDKSLQRGRVLSITPEGIVVDFEDKSRLCTLKGKLKFESTKAKNLVVVGDFVRVDTTNAICHVEKRHSVLSRKEALHQKKVHILASNIDQVLITVSIDLPPLKPHLIDRFVIAARKGEMDPILVINKIDLLQGSSKKLFHHLLKMHSSFGLRVIPVSGKTMEGIEDLKKQMENKASVFAGESGVGKSSLINAVTGLNLSTTEVTRKTGRGVHTTVGAKLIPLSCGGWCIDTPGIQSFGLWDLKRGDIEEYFHEIFEMSKGCKFPDCKHESEPACAVKRGVERGEIDLLRFDSYRTLMGEIQREH